MREDLNRFPRGEWSRKTWELHSLMTVGQIIMESAIERKESRGSHYRTDFPQKDEEQSRVIVIKKTMESGQGMITNRHSLNYCVAVE